MSEINQFSTYSTMSSSNNKIQQDYEKILKIIKDFTDIDNYTKAKNYLINELKLKEIVQNYPIGNNSYVSITENQQFLSINFKFMNDNMIYNYKK